MLALARELLHAVVLIGPDPYEVIVIDEDPVRVARVDRDVVRRVAPAVDDIAGLSKTTTVGAERQHVPIGGFCVSEVSSSVSVSGRCVTQIWSFASTKTPVMEPKIQLFGMSRGQPGSTTNRGAFAAGFCAPTDVTAHATASAVASSRRCLERPMWLRCMCGSFVAFVSIVNFVTSYLTAES